jgi:hypothetical protein
VCILLTDLIFGSLAKIIILPCLYQPFFPPVHSATYHESTTPLCPTPHHDVL